MTKLEVLAIPLKKASEVDILKPLKNIITVRYQSSEQESYISAINEFSKLRNNAVCRTLDYNENSLEIIYRYFDQLIALESKIPVNELQIPFKWRDAFDRGSIFGGRISLTMSSLAYEKVCVLFNIGALQSQVAACQSADSDDAMKLSVKLFQNAAGVFNHLKSTVHLNLQQDSTPDLLPDTLTAISTLMIAQAQEVVAIKASSDKMKDAIVAKLFSQCDEFYGEALRNMQKEPLKPLWEKDWLAKVAVKQSASQALAMYHQAQVCNDSKAVGEEIAWLTCALELFKVVQAKSGDPSLFKEEMGKAQMAFNLAIKDNDFIYHERVPDIRSLTPIDKAPLAKPSALPSHFCTSLVDLFESLVPMVVQQALAQYDVRKQEIVNCEISKLRESTQLLNSILATLNLPAAIEDTSGETLPQSLRDKANNICEKGGIKKLDTLLQELPELLKRNKDLLEESERQLMEEKFSDEQLRIQFKELWTRTPSEKLTMSFQENAEIYRKVIVTAIQADSTIRDKYEMHKEGINLLSQGPQALVASLPSASITSSNISSAAGHKLRSLMEDTETIKAERDSMESELKGASTDMKEVFLAALTLDGVVNEPVLSVESLSRAFGKLQQQVQDSVVRQETLVAEIQKAHSEFSAGTESGGSREVMLKKLASAHDIFIELLENLQEGTKFYNDLTHLLVNFQSKINDFCFARRTEKEELMKDLTHGLATQAVGATPKLPAHHQLENDKVSPPRPPPPQTNPFQATPQLPPIRCPQVPYPLNSNSFPIPPGGYQYPLYQVYTPMPQGYNPYYSPTAQQSYPTQQPGGYTYPAHPNTQWPPRS